MQNSTRLLTTTIVDAPDELSSDIQAWSALASRADEPYAAPDWCLAWWRHVAPASARLRVIVVHDDHTLVAVAPFYCERTWFGLVRYRLLGVGTSPRLVPVATAPHLQEAARQVAVALAGVRPRPDIVEFDAVPCDSPWPDLVADAWPGRQPRIDRDPPIVAPMVALTDSFDGWLATKSRNFRQQARRHRRRLAERGATFRVVTDPHEARTRMADFERLHEARWRYRGGSGVLDPSVMDMLRDAAAAMTPTGGLQLHLIEADDDIIAAHIFLTAGSVVTYWLGGFDEAWGSDQPSLQALLDMVARALTDGRRRFDLGPGAQAYKDRLSDQAGHVCATRLFPRGPRRLLAMVSRAPGRLMDGARRRAFAAVPTHRKDQIKRWLRDVRD